MQFFAQSVEVTPSLGVQKSHLVLGAAHGDAVAVQQFGQRLHVKVGAGVAPGYQFNGNFARVGQHDRAVG